MDLFELENSFNLPNKNALFDPLPDGRLIATDGTNVWIETDVGSTSFTSIGTFQNSLLAGYVRISPSGRRAALISSDGKRITIFDPLLVAVEKIFESGNTASFDSEWIDDSILAVTLAEIGQGTLLKFFNVVDGTQKTIVRNLGDASGGVTFDPSSRLLYTGIGFLSDVDPKVGLIKAFPESQWSESPDGGIDFENAGTPVANFLSASFLGFDKFGNLYVGGGDAFGGTGDLNYAAVVRKRAVDNALLGGAVIDPTSSMAFWQRFDPDPNVNQSWFVNANRKTGAMYFKSYGASVVNVFRPTVLGSGIGVVWQGQFQLGDNAFYYADADYVGLTIEFPIVLKSETTGSSAATFTVLAREVQTLQGDGHLVEVIGRNDKKNWITLGTGRLKSDRLPITVCSIAVDFSSLGSSPYYVILRIRIDPSPTPQYYDDIILTEVSVDSDSMVAMLGFAKNWVPKK